MTDVVTICNIALGYADSDAVIIDPELDPRESEEAKWCGIYYEGARDETLRAYDWNAATGFRVMADLTVEGETVGGWLYQYAVPADCLRSRYIVNPADRKDQTIPFTTANNVDQKQVILTDMQNAELCFTRAITDPTLFDPLLADAISRALAAKLTGPLTGDMQLKQANYNAWRQLGLRATAADANEVKEDEEPLASWHTVRGISESRPVDEPAS